MTVEIPECAEVCEDVLRSSMPGDPSIDQELLLAAIENLVWARLRELTIERTDVRWAELESRREELSVDHRALAAYLSTWGAVGLALNDKLSLYLKYLVPKQLADLAKVGEFTKLS